MAPWQWNLLIYCNLQALTTYYYCAAASNLGGAVFGNVMLLTLLASPPVARTDMTIVNEQSVGHVEWCQSIQADQLTLHGFDMATPIPEHAMTFLVYGPRNWRDRYWSRSPTRLHSHKIHPKLKQTILRLCVASNEAGTAFGELVMLEIRKKASIAPLRERMFLFYDITRSLDVLLPLWRFAIFILRRSHASTGSDPSEFEVSGWRRQQ